MLDARETCGFDPFVDSVRRWSEMICSPRYLSSGKPRSGALAYRPLRGSLSYPQALSRKQRRRTVDTKMSSTPRLLDIDVTNP
jgi:hypothetical protein